MIRVKPWCSVQPSVLYSAIPSTYHAILLRRQDNSYLLKLTLSLFFRVVKEEISDDSAKLPCFNGRVVSWVRDSQSVGSEWEWEWEWLVTIRLNPWLTYFNISHWGFCEMFRLNFYLKCQPKKIISQRLFSETTFLFLQTSLRLIILSKEQQ